MFEDLRSFLDHLEQNGDLVRVSHPVEPRFGIARVIRAHDARRAVLMEHVVGYTIPVAAGIFCRRDFVAAALGCDPTHLLAHLQQAWKNPVPPVIVEDGPVKEVVHTELDLLAQLPIPTHFEKDAGPYITSGVIIARDPDTGVRNASFARMQVTGKDRLAIMINQYRHLWDYWSRAAERGQPLEVAIVIGPPPAVYLEGAMPAGAVPGDVDELAAAGGLLGQPIRITPCETLDLEAPAEAEIVIEGLMPPGVSGQEGPFADYPGVYDAPPRPSPVVEVRAITHRRDPIYLDILPSSMEHLLLGGIPREAELLARLQAAMPNVTDFHLTPGGVCRFHGIIQMRKTRQTDPRHAILTAYAPTEANRDLKMVIVVDEDIDPRDPQDVEWALATRVQWDRDVLLIQGVAGALDPSAIVLTPREARARGEVLTSKVGIDATRPLVGPELRLLFEKAQIPEG